MEWFVNDEDDEAAKSLLAQQTCREKEHDEDLTDLHEWDIQLNADTETLIASSRSCASNNDSPGSDTLDGRDIAEDSLSNKLLDCCCGGRRWKYANAFDKTEYPLLFRGKHLIGTIIGIILYYYDIISDIYLAEEYFRLKRWEAFGFTASFILFPLLIMNSINISWYIRDFIAERRKKFEVTNFPVWFLRIFCSMPLLSGPVARNIEYMYHGIKSRSAKASQLDTRYHYRQMIYEDTDAAMLTMFEAFLESAPQLILQMYIILTDTHDDSILLRIVQGIAIFGSWISVSGSLVSYQNALRASHSSRDSDVSARGTILYYLWRTCEVGPRMIVFAVFAAQFKYYTLLAVIIPHWIIMSVWVAYQKPDVYTKRFEKIIFNIVLGYILILSYQSVQQGRTRYKLLLYYFITYMENLVMIAAWAHFTDHREDWYYYPIIGFVICNMMVHSIALLLYYKRYRPRNHYIISCLNHRKDDLRKGVEHIIRMAKAYPKIGTKKFPYTRRVQYEKDETFDEVDGKDLKLTSVDKTITSNQTKDKYHAEGCQDEGDARHINKNTNFKVAPSRRTGDEFLDISRSHDDDELDGRYSILDDDTNVDTKKNVSGFDKATSVALTCCCGNNCWKTNVYFNTEEYPFLFRGLDLIATVLSTVFFLYDVISDVVLAEEYYRLQRWISFAFTASLIFFPHLVMNMINISWYYRDYMAEKKKEKTTHGWKWFLRVVLSLPFMLGPIVRNVEYIYYGCKSRSASLSDGRRSYFYQNVLYEDADAAMLRMFEAFLESAPQLVLQLYIIMTETQNDNLLMQIVRVAAMFGSWVGVSWTLVSYHKALRASHNIKEQGISACGVIFYYIWRACEVAPRTIVLALFAAQFGFQILVVPIGLHWVAMSIWLGCQKQEMMNKTSREKWIFNIVFGYVLIFCFQNVQKGKTRYRAMFYYFVTFSENIIMLILWAYFTQHKSEWFYLAAIGTVPLFMVIQIIVQLLYYKLIHPSHKEIVLCQTNRPSKRSLNE
ncbi:uncharacterized protein LOC134705216 [Mytilus trossulus]|uniref:uncharacterized protein LOC134705216 n=1 Tax=Mytilus trossulus TaxID=6551 RepID=UPI003007ED50